MNIGDTPNGHELQGPAKDILVVVFSKTPEKVAHFEAASTGTRVQFIDVHRLAEGYNVAPEDTGNRKKNALQKAMAIMSSFEKLKDPLSAEHQNLLAQCQARGIPYDPTKIFLMIEDSTFTTSLKVWPFLRDKLKGLVSDELLIKYSKSKEGKESEPGPGAETGPMVSAVGGFLRFHNLLNRAQSEAAAVSRLTEADRIIKNQSTVILRQLSADTNKLHIFDAENQTLLCDLPEFEDQTHHLIDLYAHISLRGQKETIANNFQAYLRHDGPRAKVFEKMNNAIFSQLPTANGSSIASEQLTSAEHITRPVTTAPAISQQPQTLREKIYDVIACPLFDNAGGEGVILKPYDPNDDTAKTRALYRLTNMTVARQLIARDMFKPIVIWDDGCYRDAVRTLVSLANKGMAKDFMPMVRNHSDQDIRHLVSSYFDVLRFDPHKYDRDRIGPFISDDALAASATRQQQALQNITDAIIRERSVGYHDFIQPQQLTKIHAEGTPPSSERFTVAHFISATSDNQTLNQQARALGTYAAKRGFGYVWGGMNMHSGGEGFKAYKEAGGVHAAAYSTPAIAAAETEDGRLPQNADYREWSRNIYERMAGMIAASDVIVVSPGGWGTFQELLALMVLKKEAPELFEGKKIIIHNPKLHEGEAFSGGRFWSRTIRAVFNVENRNADFSSVRDKDVYIVHDEAELSKITDVLHNKWQAKHQPSPGPGAPATRARAPARESSQP